MLCCCRNHGSVETAYAAAEVLILRLEGEYRQLQTRKIKPVRDASGSDGSRVEVMGCGPFPTRELNLGCETF